MRNLLLVLTLTLAACVADPNLDDEPPADPHQVYPTARDAARAACAELCAWSASCGQAEGMDPECTYVCLERVCARPCTTKRCADVDCELPPSGTDDEISTCLDDTHERAQAGECGVAIGMPSACSAAMFP
jgi:hypothetical protein